MTAGVGCADALKAPVGRKFYQPSEPHRPVLCSGKEARDHQGLSHGNEFTSCRLEGWERENFGTV